MPQGRFSCKTIACLLFLLPQVLTWAEEPVEAFLDALRQRGYYEQALVYLDRQQSLPGLSEERRQQLAYERAMLAITASDRETDFTKRIGLLESALSSLAALAERAPGAPLSVDLGRGQLEAQTRKALLLLNRWKYSPEGPERNLLRDQSEQAFSQVREFAAKLSEQLRGLLQEMQRRPPKEQDVVLRDRWRATYIAAQAAAPSALLNSAELVQEERPEYRKRLKAAATGFQDLAERYARYPERYLYFVLNSGRCLQALEKYADARARFQEVLETQGLPLPFSAAATRYTMETHIAESPDGIPKAIQLGDRWIKEHPREAPEVTAPVRLALARALQAQSPSLKGGELERNRARTRQLLQQLVQERVSEFLEASTLLQELRQETQGDSSDLPVLGSFEEARAEGDAILIKLQPLQSAAQVLAERKKSVGEAHSEQELEQELASVRNDLHQLRSQAANFYRRALELANASVSPEDLHQVRYRLAYLTYQLGEDFDTVVLAEFLARHQSDHPDARNCARLALGAYSRLHEQHPSSRDFAARRLIDMAQYTAQRWPNEEQGQTAMLMLIRFLVSHERISDAQDYVEKLPKDSPLRAEAEWTTGVGLFREFQSAVAELGPTANIEDKPDLLRLRTTARTWIERALEQTRGQPPTSNRMLGQLCLARIYISQGQGSQAVRLLTDKESGPFTLLREQPENKIVQGLAEEIYRTTLQAYLTRWALGEGSSEDQQRFTEIMDSLRKELSSTPEGRQRLVAILVSSAKDLHREFVRLSADRRGNAAQSLAQVLEQVPTITNDPATLNWVAQTSLEISEWLDDGGGAQGWSRKHVLSQAARWLQESLREAGEQMDDALRLQTRLRLATILRKQQAYSAAMDMFEQILSDNPNLLNVQIEAAYTYQEGGAYRYAIKGGRPDKKTQRNVIWGWERISAVLARQMRAAPEAKQKYNDLFHEARYNIAWARFREAQAITGPKRLEYLKQARQAITSIQMLYPDQGGEASKAKYEALLEEIRLALAKEAAS